MKVFRPADHAEACDIVAWAAGAKTPLAISGNGSKSGLGYPSQAEHGLSLGGLTGVLEYEPSELVLVARAGTPLAEIEGLLDRNNQMLAFEPPPWQALLGGTGEPTLGGVIACNVAGPRRLTAGAARDHFLGYLGINGRGESYKAGSKVVKNVTGYDLCKVIAGSMGTLSVMTEINVKVLPKPEACCTMAVAGLGAPSAMALMAKVLNGPYEVTAAAYLTAEVAACSGIAAIREAGVALAVLRLEGPEPSVAYRRETVDTILAEAGGTGRIHLAHDDSVALWREIGAATAFARAAEACPTLWRICTTPNTAPDIAASVAALGPCVTQYDWAGGLLYLATGAPDGAGATIRAGVARQGGHATILRAPAAVSATVPLFQPALPGVDALNARVKDSFDPLRILNPGRMSQGL